MTVIIDQRYLFPLGSRVTMAYSCGPSHDVYVVTGYYENTILKATKQIKIDYDRYELYGEFHLPIDSVILL